jgi:hypothetical protein
LIRFPAIMPSNKRSLSLTWRRANPSPRRIAATTPRCRRRGRCPQQVWPYDAGGRTQVRVPPGLEYARDLFQAPLNRDHGPIWTYDRMGQTRTELPDGRLVRIGGDPDFCIYNDVVVFGPTDQIEIYGYPREVFPPTGFHTGSFVGNSIILVGCLGFPDDRRPGHTPVYSLDLSDYRISEVRTAGEAPGWVFQHEADVTPDGFITIRGREVIKERDGERRYRRNVEEFSLDTRSWVWRRLTSRNWLQFSIRQEDRGLFVLEKDPKLELLFPREVEHTVVPCEDLSRIRFVVQDVPVSVAVAVRDIEVIVEGQLPVELEGRIAEEVRANAEAAIQRRCVLQRV